MNTKANNRIVVVKLGGAAITDKRGVCELSAEDQLEQTLDQVSTAYRIIKATGYQLILVHGAGSFGHPQAKNYHLKTGWSASPTAEFLKGYSHIRACLQQLNHSIISRLESKNVPVLAMPPIDFIETTDCEKTSTQEFVPMVSRVSKYLDLGFVPVLHGDAVLDHIRGCTILSGDIIMYQLTQLLPITRCIFVTDVPGIYQSDPKLSLDGSNHLISQVFVGDKDEETFVDEVTSLADVTGGMQGKIKWAKKIVSDSNQIDVVICKHGSKEALDMMTLKESNTDHQMTLFVKKEICSE